jgi:hypothetical protein
MHRIRSFSLVWLALGWPVLVQAQFPVESPQQPAPTENSTPLVLREAGNAAGDEPEEEVEEVIRALRERMRAIADSSISAAEKQAEAEKIVSENPLIFRQMSTEMPAARPASVDEVIHLLEQRFFEVAADAAPDEETRRLVEHSHPDDSELEPIRPILIARKAHRGDIVVTREAEQQEGYTPWWKNTAATVVESPVEAGPVADEVPEEEVKEEAVKVEFLADEQVTAEMHDDTTVLRAVEDDEGDLVLFDALHLWVGGSAQGDIDTRTGLFNLNEGGDRNGELKVRRAEGILRASLMHGAEVKAQYDFDSTVFRDLYWRWLSEVWARATTAGLTSARTRPGSMSGAKTGPL